MAETTFSLRKNAKRAAEKAIRDGIAPSIDYGFKSLPNGRFEIVWYSKGGTEVVPPTEQIEGEIATATAEAEAPASDPFARIEASEKIEALGTTPEKYGFEDVMPAVPDKEESPSDFADDDPDPWPPGTRVQVALSKKRVRLGTVDYQVDRQYWRIVLDGAPGGVSGLYRVDQLSATDAPMPEPTPKKKRQGAAQTSNRQRSRSTELDAAAATGVMPTKPIVTSKANPHYQKRFDQLEKWAMADDWNEIRGYEVKGVNSYAKMVKQYRDRLLTAHAAAMQKVA